MLFKFNLPKIILFTSNFSNGLFLLPRPLYENSHNISGINNIAIILFAIIFIDFPPTDDKRLIYDNKKI